MVKLLAAILLATGLQGQIITPKWLDARAKHWAAVLHLEDWETHVSTVRRAELDNGLVAQSGWDVHRKLFTIVVIDERDWMDAAKVLPMLKARTPRTIRRETDESICHEFVHLRLSDLGVKDKDVEEATVVRITAALMRKGQL